MIYFLVNNDYHLLDVGRHLPSLVSLELSLIQVPHSLKEVKGDSRFARVFTFPAVDLTWKSILFGFKVMREVRHKVSCQICPSNEDVLVLFTEFEATNCLIAERFKECGARVFLLEEGFATYLCCGGKWGKEKTFSPRLRTMFAQYLLGLKRLRFFKADKMSFPKFDDSIIDGVCLYLDVPITRKIKKFVIRREIQIHERLSAEKVLFLNEDLYNFYLPFDDHLENLRFVLSSLESHFSKIWFKFHPREKPEDIKKIKDGLSQFGRVEFIEKSEPVEKFAETIDAKFAVGFFSFGLMNLAFSGMTSVYLFRLFPKLARLEIFTQVEICLRLLGYQFPRSIEDVSPEFSSGLEKKILMGSLWSKTLAEIVKR